MSRTQRLSLGAGAAALVLIAAVWFLFLRDTAPAAPTLGTAIDSVGTGDGETAPPAPAADGIEGTWTADTTVGDDINSGSYVGYRVQEVLRNLGEKAATGRTPELTGSLTIEGTAVTAVNIVADMTKLVSDSAFRDGAIATRGPETRTFPTATFALTSPVELPASADDGSAFTVTVVGDLELHGVTKEISIELQAQLVDGSIVVVGTTHIVMSDFDITPPKAGPVLEISDEGELELQLFFTRG